MMKFMSRINGGERTVPVVGTKSFPQIIYKIEVDLHQDIAKDIRSKLLIKVQEFVKRRVGWRAL